MSSILQENTCKAFAIRFGDTPTLLVSAPGRINLIGEHIDYNDGFALLGALDKSICFAVSKTEGEESTVLAKDLNEEIIFSVHQPIESESGHWFGYFRGILQELKKRKKTLQNFHLTFSSLVPVGAGVSSSAALECGFIFALNELFNLQLTRLEMAQIGQLAENHFAGVQCGIMDQMACVFSKEKHLLLLDCLSLQTDYLPFEWDNYSLVLLNTGVKHRLQDSCYNNRREECSTGLKIIQNQHKEVQSFRGVTLNQLHEVKDKMSDSVFNRCLYVVQEIERVQMAVQSLKDKNIIRLGELLYESHRGLNELYEVSCDELNFLVTQTFNQPAVLGARMMGGGFGGCTINIVHETNKNEWIEEMKMNYKNSFNRTLESYKVPLSNGVVLNKNYIKKQ